MTVVYVEPTIYNDNLMTINGGEESTKRSPSLRKSIRGTLRKLRQKKRYRSKSVSSLSSRSAYNSSTCNTPALERRRNVHVLMHSNGPLMGHHSDQQQQSGKKHQQQQQQQQYQQQNDGSLHSGQSNNNYIEYDETSTDDEYGDEFNARGYRKKTIRAAKKGSRSGEQQPPKRIGSQLSALKSQTSFVGRNIFTSASKEGDEDPFITAADGSTNPGEKKTSIGSKLLSMILPCVRRSKSTKNSDSSSEEEESASRGIFPTSTPTKKRKTYGSLKIF